jgi:Xaa-Pro dipeptidase
MENPERTRRVQALLRESKLDLLVCALPANVLMLSGYWPVVGTGVALAFAEGRIALLIPEDEHDLASTSWADEIHTFHPGSLDRLETAESAIRAPLSRLVGDSATRIGFERGEFSEPASYAAMHLYGGAMERLLAECLPNARLDGADALLTDLRARKTSFEIERLRTACRIASHAFRKGAAAIEVSATETRVAEAFRSPLSEGPDHFSYVQRSGGFAWCMSGPNSALASGAYARSRARKIQDGDLVLIHCNSYADGYWTDITRTFCVGNPDDRQAELFEAVFRARQAALDAVAPGVPAAMVDGAAREVLRERGFGDAFRHSTGHGVGFGAIDANALPRLHPRSPDRIEPGMVFNIEPAVYFDGYGGIRHCDLVAATATGYELLTAFQCERAELVAGV